MPKSKNRKKHKKRAKQFKAETIAVNKRAKAERIKMYQQQLLAKHNEMLKQTGEVETVTDIDVDLDVDDLLNMDIEDVDVIEDIDAAEDTDTPTESV